MLFKLFFFFKKIKDWKQFWVDLGGPSTPTLSQLNHDPILELELRRTDNYNCPCLSLWSETDMKTWVTITQSANFSTYFLILNNGFSFSSYATTTTTATVSSSAQKKWALFTEHTVSWSKFSNPSRSSRQGSSPLIWFNKWTLQFRCPSFELAEKTHRTGCFVDFSLV